MEVLKFEIQINAKPEIVWKCLWDLENYKKWTSHFSKGSYYTTENFIQGGRVHLLLPSGEGMFSDIEVLIPNEKLVFSHLGEIKDFKEQALDENSSQWTEAKEKYMLDKQDAGTILRVECDTFHTHIDYMNKTFPKALNEVKRMAEDL